MATEKAHPIRNSVLATLIGGAITTLVVYLIPGGWAWIVKEGKSGIVAVATWFGSSLAVAQFGHEDGRSGQLEAAQAHESLDGSLRTPMFGAAWLEPMVEDGVWEKSWPLYPLAEANGVFFILSRSYVLAGGAEDPIDYLRYCRANGMFRRTLLLTPSTPQARQALLLLLDRIRTFSRVEIPAEHLEYLQKQTEKRANQASEPTPPSVTDRADARSAPAGVVAHL